MNPNGKVHIYLLSHGMKNWDGCDEEVGVFTDFGKLEEAYNRLLSKREQEIRKDGFSYIEEIKVYEFPWINQMMDDLDNVFEIKRRVDPEQIGLFSSSP